MKKGTKNLLIGGIVLFAAVVVLSITERARTRREYVAPKPQAKSESLEYKLATIDKGYVSRDDIIVTRFRTLLDQLGSKYHGTRQQISDATVVAQNLLRDKYGIEESLLNIMEDMNQVVITKVNPSYPLYATAYVQLRKTGASRQQAIIGIETFLKSIGRY